MGIQSTIAASAYYVEATGLTYMKNCSAFYDGDSIQKWNPEMEKARMEGEREWERQKEEQNLLQITVIQMSLGYVGFPVK